MVMLRLFRLLVRSKLDHGSFVYGSATKSELSITHPVHNMVIRLATGATSTSRPESLYAESGEPPLSLLRYLPLCGHAAQLATQLHHHVCGASSRPTVCNRLESSTRSPRPAGVRLRQLLQQLHIILPHINPCRLS
jgi:hypothetical protein